MLFENRFLLDFYVIYCFKLLGSRRPRMKEYFVCLAESRHLDILYKNIFAFLLESRCLSKANQYSFCCSSFIHFSEVKSVQASELFQCLYDSHM